jgi:pimeloyl-ACP methyl ester carboxylesterase
MPHTPRYVPAGFVTVEGDEPYAALTSKPAPDTAVVFVHGFWGSPTATWGQFKDMVDQYSDVYPWWDLADMFFYAYQSTNIPIRFNAAGLTRYVLEVWNGKWRASHSRADQPYKDLILVGHSEGGVLIRRMILDRLETKVAAMKKAQTFDDPNSKLVRDDLQSDFILSAFVRLFAPAISGTNFSAWLGFIDRALPASASSLVRNELAPGSPVLRTLRKGTERARVQFPYLRSLFTRPLFGISDHVVFSDSYQGEQPLWEEGMKNAHRNICKPSIIYKRPLEFVDKTSEAGQ